jgi:hypothetical protein
MMEPVQILPAALVPATELDAVGTFEALFAKRPPPVRRFHRLTTHGSHCV